MFGFYCQKLKDFYAFIKRDEIDFMVILLCAAILCYEFLNIIFFTVSADALVQPTLEPFYYAVFSVLIWFGFRFIVWRALRRDSPEIIKALKIPKYELDYHYAFAFYLADFLTLLGVASLVFPG